MNEFVLFFLLSDSSCGTSPDIAVSILFKKKPLQLHMLWPKAIVIKTLNINRITKLDQTIIDLIIDTFQALVRGSAAESCATLH